ncbi:hypothetical protein PDE_03447 [Penicillium oxalicum 114-2]|uniref:Uncharacterized protein n=1 Tax=Penicillium oxalicum (strain 114-2 / CGMCC 5302) TaxID=933388 RepID=S7ZII1_PENO1|nr:hypothetical protein PDE_03447 [Penicillium oxalicum 114-2]
MSSSNLRFLSRADVEQLVCRYPDVAPSFLGQTELFSQVLGQVASDEPSLVVVAWQVTELMAHLVCVVGPCTASPWYMRMVMTPDFLFLGMHPVLPGAAFREAYLAALLPVYFDSLLPSVAEHPLACGYFAFHPLSFEQEWVVLIRALAAYLGSTAGRVDHYVPCESEEPTPMATDPVSADATVSCSAPVAYSQDVEMQDAPEAPAAIEPVPACTTVSCSVPVVASTDVAMENAEKNPAAADTPTMGPVKRGGKGKRKADEPLEGDELRGKLDWGPKAQGEEEELPVPETPGPILTKDGRVITPQWTASFGPPPAPRKKWR